MKEKTRVYIALGTNVGNRDINLELALEEIRKIAEISKRSSIYNTEPVGYKHQRNFLNMVIEIKTALTPVELMIKLESIEHKMGKLRELTDGPRSIDLDILFYNKKIVQYKHLMIPHPRLHQRSFVLIPLAEIAPGFIHPTMDKTIEILRNSLKKSEKVAKWTNKK